MNETELRKLLEAKREHALFEERVTIAVWIALIIVVAGMVIVFSTII